MGASYVSRTYPDMPESELAKHIDNDRAQDAHEDGCSYSGSWGVKHGFDVEYTGYGSNRAVKTFDSVRDADDYISDNNDKWGPLTAVKARIIEMKLPDGRLASTDYGTGASIPMGKATLALHEKHKEAHTALQAFGPAILARVKTAKSKTKGCSKCGSAIATKYIQSLQCPVCRHDYLITDTDTKKLVALRAKADKAKAAAETARKVELDKLAQKHSKLVWVVGGMCSS